MARKHQQERNEAIKQMIIDAALKICIDEGYSEVTVRRIGDMIGYSTGVIYYHFRDKRDIIDCLDQRLDEEVYSTVSSITDPSMPIKDNLSKLYEFTCDLAYNNYEKYRRIFATSRIEANQYTRKMWLNMISEWVSASAERGDIKNDNIEEKSRCVLSYILGYNLLWFEVSKTDYETAIANRDTAVNMVLSGVLNA